MLNCLCVGIGGFLGSILRYLVGLLPMNPENGFPIKTLIINVLGAFALGLIGALAVRDASLNPRLVLMLKVGVCGGFTTFSTFAFEASTLMQNGQTALGITYMLLSMLLGVAAIFLAQMLIN